MERVLITSKSGNVYFDQMGRPLHTMGDTNVTVGQWVWTNGTTIYGHQTAGYNPPVLGGDTPVLPIPAYISGTNSGYKVVKILKDGTDKTYITDLTGYGIPPLMGYVGDDKHAYGYVPAAGSWYDLVTKTQLSGVQGEDMCVSDDGDLLTIAIDLNASYHNAPISTVIVPKITAAKGSDGFYTTTLSYISDAVPGSEATSSDRTNGHINISRNGINDTSISVSAYMDRAISAVTETLNEIQSINPDAEKVLPDDFGFESNTHPSSFVSRAYANASNLRIYPDGTYSAIISCYASGVCFPYITHDYYDQKSKSTYKVKEWIAVKVVYTAIIGIGRADGQYSNNTTVSTQQGLLAGGAPASDTGNPQKFDIIPGIYGVQFYDANRPIKDNDTSKYANYYIVGYQKYNLSGGSVYNDKPIYDTYTNNGGSSQYVVSAGGGIESYDIGGGYTAGITSDGLTVNVLDPDGVQIVTIGYTSSLGNWPAVWTSIVAGKLSEGMYILTNPANTSLGVLIAKNGVASKISDIQQPASVFTLASYRYGNQLKRNVQAIIKGIVGQ